MHRSNEADAPASQMLSPELVPSVVEVEVEEEVVEEEEEDDEEEFNSIEQKQEIEIVEEPNREMTFDTSHDAYLYYARFAKEKGFAVAKRTSRKGIDGKVTDRRFECTRAGKARVRTSNPTKPRPQSKIGCLACVTVVCQEDEKWKFNKIVLQHNHDLSPSKSRYFKSNRILNDSVKRKLDLNDKAGIKMYKTFDALQIEAGGRDKLPFLKKDCRNYLDKERRLRLQEGDAEAMYEYFTRMRADNENFYFAMDLDDKCRLRNVFWADARSRAACKEFGDVVTFDTTYLVNKYSMPFAPFVGINHHGHSTLLGCGLISHEDTESFIWLFKTWKACMSGSAMKAIITDQAMAMKNAIEIVFPDTRHRWCIWHIMKKLPEKFGGHREFKKISSTMRWIVFDSLTVEQFENSWARFTEKYELQSNTWLEGLYLEKKRWVPAYLKDVFWAGMSSTQRSEGMNHYFDDYIHSKTTLKQFVEQYENALESKVEKENQEDVNCFTTFIPLVTKSELEKQIQGVYTHAKVREFQEQILAKCDCLCSKRREAGIESEFEVKQEITFGEGEEEMRREVSFIVGFNAHSNEAHCSCRLFEFRGMVCTHQLMVWHQMGVKRLPDKYVLRRWCKNVKRVHTKVPICYNKSFSPSQARRHDYMCKLADEVVDVADESEEMFNIVVASLRELKLKVDEIASVASVASGVVGSNVVSVGDSISLGDDSIPTKGSVNVLDPECVKRKGRPPTKRLIGAVEKGVTKRKRATKKISPNEKSKKVDEIADKDPIGTQESVMNTMGQPSYIGHSMWPNMPYNMIPNMAHGGIMFPSMAHCGSIFPNMAQGGGMSWMGQSFANSQHWMGQSWRAPQPSQPSQQSFMDMMNRPEDDEE